MSSFFRGVSRLKLGVYLLALGLAAASVTSVRALDLNSLNLKESTKRYTLYKGQKDLLLSFFPVREKIVIRYRQKRGGVVLREHSVSSTNDVERAQKMIKEALKREGELEEDEWKRINERLVQLKYRKPEENGVLHLTSEESNQDLQGNFLSRPLETFEVTGEVYQLRVHTDIRGSGRARGVGIVSINRGRTGGEIHQVQRSDGAPYIIVRDRRNDIVFLVDQEFEKQNGVLTLNLLTPKARKREGSFENLKLRQFLIVKKRGNWEVVKGASEKGKIRERKEISLLIDSAKHRPVFQLEDSNKFFSGLGKGDLQRRVRRISLHDKGRDTDDYKNSYLQCMLENGILDYGNQINRLRERIRKLCLRKSDVELSFHLLYERFTESFNSGGRYLSQAQVRNEMISCLSSHELIRRFSLPGGEKFTYFNLGTGKIENLKLKEDYQVTSTWKSHLVNCQKRVHRKSLESYLKNRFARDFPAIHKKTLVKKMLTQCQNFKECRRDYGKIQAWMRSSQKFVGREHKRVVSSVDKCLEQQTLSDYCLSKALRELVLQHSARIYSREMSSLRGILQGTEKESNHSVHALSQRTFHECLNGRLREKPFYRSPASYSHHLEGVQEGKSNKGVAFFDHKIFHCARSSSGESLSMSFRENLKDFAERYNWGEKVPQNLIEKEVSQFSRQDHLFLPKDELKSSFSKSLRRSKIKILSEFIKNDHQRFWQRMTNYTPLSEIEKRKGEILRSLNYLLGPQGKTFEENLRDYLVQASKTHESQGFEIYVKNVLRHYFTERARVWSKLARAGWKEKYKSLELSEIFERDPVSAFKDCLSENPLNQDQLPAGETLKECDGRFLLNLGAQHEEVKWHLYGKSYSQKGTLRNEVMTYLEYFRGCTGTYSSYRKYFLRDWEIGPEHWLSFCRTMTGIEFEESMIARMQQKASNKQSRDLASINEALPSYTREYRSCLLKRQEGASAFLTALKNFGSKEGPLSRLFNSSTPNRLTTEFVEKLGPEGLEALAGMWLGRTTSSCFREVSSNIAAHFSFPSL